MGNEADILSVLETFKTDPNRKTLLASATAPSC